MNPIKVCSICHDYYLGWGNNAWPVNDGECCDACNDHVVIPARMRRHATKAIDEARKAE